MIIAHYTGKGYGTYDGRSEYIVLEDSIEDFQGEYKTLDEAIEAQCAHHFKLSKIYDTDKDYDFSSLPYGRSLVNVDSDF